jgi:hypothetical protein
MPLRFLRLLQKTGYIDVTGFCCIKFNIEMI